MRLGVVVAVAMSCVAGGALIGFAREERAEYMRSAPRRDSEIPDTSGGAVPRSGEGASARTGFAPPVFRAGSRAHGDTFEFLVADAEGAPVRDARIADPVRGETLGLTAQDGTAIVKRGGEVNLRFVVRKAGYSSKLGIARAGVRERITLAEGRPLTGTVMDAGGAVVAGATLQLRDAESVRDAGSTNLDGEFECHVPLTAVGELSVLVARPGVFPVMRRLTDLGWPASSHVRIQWRQGGAVAGTLRDDSGGASQSARVEFANLEGSLAATCLTDDEGGFRMAGIPEGEPIKVAVDTGSLLHDLGIVRVKNGQRQRLDAVLQAAGRVRLRTPREARSPTVLVVSSSGFAINPWLEREEDGWCSIPLAPGVYRVTVFLDEWPEHAWDGIVVKPGEDAVLSMTVSDLVKTRGRVVDHLAGNGIDGADVLWRGREQVKAVSGPDGRFAIHTDRRGAGTLVVRHPDYEEYVREETSLDDGLVVRLVRRK